MNYLKSCLAILALSLVCLGGLAAEGAIKSVTAFTEVFGEGQKLTFLAVEYDRDLDASKLEAASFAVEGRTLTAVYANSAAERRPAPAAPMGPPGSAQKAQQGVNGRFVILELSRDDAAAALFVAKGFTSERRAAQASIRQLMPLATVSGPSVAAPASAFGVTKVSNLVVDNFVQMEYKDPATGVTVKYNLFIPKDYDPKKAYPLVMFIHDAGASSTETTTTLVQGNGATVWASPAEQAKHPAFVLAPQFSTAIVNDKSEASAELEAVANLIQALEKQYSLDARRIYATGQSGGCMSSIYLNIRYPGLFAASFLVAGQWDPSVVSPLAKDKLWIVVSQGDQKAFPGMNAITSVIEKAGTKVSRDVWSGRSTSDEFSFGVAKMMAEGNPVKYVALQRGTVVSPGLPDDAGSNHICTWRIAYSIEGIRDWLFAQTNTTGLSGKELFDIGVSAGRAGDAFTGFVYLNAALEAGYEGAYEWLADAYQTGKGCTIDYAEAAVYGQKAVDGGGARGATNLGILYLNGWGFAADPKRALELFQQAAKLGDFKAPRYIGIMYYKGLVGGAPDFAKASANFLAASKGGDVTANYWLGLMYEHGQGFVQDYAKAAAYYTKAAPSVGHAESVAMVALGLLYENGLGVKQDLAAAIRQYERAAALGDADAIAALARLKAK